MAVSGVNWWITQKALIHPTFCPFKNKRIRQIQLFLRFFLLNLSTSLLTSPSFFRRCLSLTFHRGGLTLRQRRFIFRFSFRLWFIPKISHIPTTALQLKIPGVKHLLQSVCLTLGAFGERLIGHALYGFKLVFAGST